MRRRLAHSEAFDIPKSVELNQRGIAMLVSSVVTMRLHAQEANAASQGQAPAPDGNKALMGFLTKPKVVLPGGSGDNAGMPKGADGKNGISGGLFGPGAGAAPALEANGTYASAPPTNSGRSSCDSGGSHANKNVVGASQALPASAALASTGVPAAGGSS